MEKGKLNEQLEYFTKEKDLSMQLHFVFKSEYGDHVPYEVTLDDKLKDEIFDAYLNELSKYRNHYYQLETVYTDNVLGPNVLLYDKVNTTKVGSDVFEYKNSDIEKYNFEVGDYGSIFGFLISFYSSELNKELRIFKKNMPTQTMSKKRYIGIINLDQHSFTQIDRDAIYFSKSIDMFCIDDSLIIQNYGVYESNFGFKELINLKAQSSFAELAKISAFWFSPKAIEKYTSLSLNTRKKLINCLNNNPILKRENYEAIKKQAKRHLKREFEVTKDGKIMINSKIDLETLITILNRDINYNEPAREVYLTRNKKLLMRYKPKATSASKK
jgi:hypothetical protein